MPRLLVHGVFCVEVEIELEDVNAAFAKDAELALLDMCEDKGLKLIWADAAGFGDAGDLKRGGGG